MVAEHSTELINDHGLKDTEALTVAANRHGPRRIAFLKSWASSQGFGTNRNSDGESQGRQETRYRSRYWSKLDGPQQAQLLADRAAILEGKSPVAPAVTPKPARYRHGETRQACSC